jgi:putative hemolysin
VGGYRAGVVREVTREVGAEGLYTSTLFQFSPELFAALDESVELGRSFVRLEYQRQTMPLNLLWRGIAVFMIRNGLQQMFGPVSISNDYASMSKELIMEFLERHRLAAPFTKMVTPRNPPKRTPVASWTERETAEITSNFAQVERIVDEIERGKRAVPVLLRHYLRLNARLLAFNVDPDFGDVVDALMLVDLRQIDERIVRHYLGGDGGADDLSER